MATVLLAGLVARAEDSKGVTGVLDFKNVSVSEVLRIYQKLSGVDLVIDSHVRQMDSKITVTTTAPLTKEEVARLIEKTLLKQAGIVVTRLDDKQASVTYNDALPVTK
jgi:type II secretory pathway component GspD/PulD (secretin)